MEIYFPSSIARTARVLVLLPLALILLLIFIPAPTTAQDAAPKSRDADSSQSHAVDDNNQRPHENPTTLRVKVNVVIVPVVVRDSSGHAVGNLQKENFQIFDNRNKPIAKLSVLTFVDLQDLPHRQTDGKNTNELRMVAAIFDRNGKYIGAIDRKVAVQWSDDDAGTRTATTFSFLLDSGAYRVRLVVRDAESRRLSAQAAVIEIP
jgi:hypothetical protein